VPDDREWDDEARTREADPRPRERGPTS
jgi:hypothetical protein